MAQSGYTPILIYASGTATNVPSASNLTSSSSGAELALNYTDGKLYYKDNSGTVQLLASKASATATVSSVNISGGTTGLSAIGGPITSSGTITLTGVLGVSNGGTGLSTIPVNGALLIGNGFNYTSSTLTAGSNITITNGAGSISIAATTGAPIVSATAPSSPSAGQLWYDSTNGVMLIYYNSQWVEDYESQLTSTINNPDMNGGLATTTSWTYSINCGAAQ